jgi:hypothetical protein
MKYRARKEWATGMKVLIKTSGAKKIIAPSFTHSEYREKGKCTLTYVKLGMFFSEVARFMAGCFGFRRIDYMR